MTALEPYDASGPGGKKITDLIRAVGIFSDLADGEIELLAGWFSAYTAPRDAVILKEGGDELFLCLVAEGAVAIHKKTSPFESIKLADIEAGGVIGEMGIIDGEVISASVRATCDSVILMVTRERFTSLVQENGALGVKILWKLANLISTRMRQTTRLLAELSMSKASWILKY